jgi:hypothetical protein
MTTTAVKERLTADLNKVKSEGGSRASRIREILQTAFAETVAEVKAGSGEIGSIAQDAIADAQTTDEFAKAKQQYTGIMAKLAELDEKLAANYGDRYQQAKQRLTGYWHKAQTWFSQTKTDLQNTGNPDPVQRMHMELGAKMAAAYANRSQVNKEQATLLLQQEAATEIADAEQ